MAENSHEKQRKDIDEFIDDDDGGFNFVECELENVAQTSKTIAQKHNYPSEIIDTGERVYRSKYK